METCTHCNKSFYRSKLKIEETGKWLKASCPDCGEFIRCLLFRETEKKQMGNGLILQAKYVGKDVKLVTVLTEDRSIDVGLNVVDIDGTPKAKNYFDMSDRLRAVNADTATLVSNIIADNINAEFGIDTTGIRDHIIGMLTMDKSEAMPFLARATALAEKAMCQCEFQFKVA